MYLILFLFAVIIAEGLIENKLFIFNVYSFMSYHF